MFTLASGKSAGTWTFDVFSSDGRRGTIVYQGSLEAPDDDLAQLYAERLFGRRGESKALWIVRRADGIRVDVTHVSVRPARERR